MVRFRLQFFYILYFAIFYYIQNYKYRDNIFFEIMFGWFKKYKTKLKKKIG